MTADEIARDLCKRSDGNLTAALIAACSLLRNARSRVEDHLPDKGMGANDLALLWRDLHPFDPKTRDLARQNDQPFTEAD